MLRPGTPRSRLRRAATAALLSVACLTAGCTTVDPDFVRPEVAVQPEWLTAELAEFDAGEPELVDWWRQFNDPVLDELVRTAYGRNNSLKIAGLRVIEAQAAPGRMPT